MIALTIEVRNAQKQSIDVGVVNAPAQKVNIKQDIVVVPVYKDVTLYEGDYEVTPRVDEQTLSTADKLMSADVTIKQIPYAEVSNIQGGKTVTIGGS